MQKLKAIDLFCGAGGVTEGLLNSDVVDVIAAVNHSIDAIKAHKINNPHTRHFRENIEDLDVSLLPQCDLLWASVECDHHSIAKGGQSRDPDSRSLADHMDKYVQHCKPTYFMVENVKEFLKWGPVIPKRDRKGNIVYQKESVKIPGEKKKLRVYKLDKNGNKMPVLVPDKTRERIFYNAWVKRIKALGYEYEYKIINSADFGAHTSRSRYFGVFYKSNVKWEFPEPTHAKDPGNTGLLKWKSCRDKINLENEGTSIFGRSYNMDLPKNLRRPLVEATLRRIAEGIKKFLLEDFIAKAYGGTQQTNGERNLSPTVTSLDDPLHTIPTSNIHSIVQIEKNDNFIAKSYGAGGQQSKIDEPLHTITTKDRHALISVEKEQFLAQIMHGSDHCMSLDEPAKTIITKDEKHLITVEKKFVVSQQYTNKPHSLDEPVKTIVTKPRQQLISIDTDSSTLDEIKEHEKRQFIIRHFSTPVFTDLDSPLGALMTEKKDTLITVDFLCNVIKDIKMRYLDSFELADITGFKPGTYLGKNETQRKYHIGNAVPPVVPEHLALMASLCMEDSLQEVA